MHGTGVFRRGCTPGTFQSGAPRGTAVMGGFLACTRLKNQSQSLPPVCGSPGGAVSCIGCTAFMALAASGFLVEAACAVGRLPAILRALHAGAVPQRFRRQGTADWPQARFWRKTLPEAARLGETGRMGYNKKAGVPRLFRYGTRGKPRVSGAQETGVVTQWIGRARCLCRV